MAILAFSQKSSKLRLPPPRLVTIRTYARRRPMSFSFPFPFGGFDIASNISSSYEIVRIYWSRYLIGHQLTSSHTSLEEEVWMSTEVEVKDAPGRPLEYGDTFPALQSISFRLLAWTSGLTRFCFFSFGHRDSLGNRWLRDCCRGSCFSYGRCCSGNRSRR
jgi:hypothetical protein